jgi:ribonucleotide monophosphatase NagD (HAD superfamily)
MQTDRGNVLMVGDRMATDILGARKAGIKSVLVKTGEFKNSDLNGGEQPDFIVDSLSEIDVLF